VNRWARPGIKCTGGEEKFVGEGKVRRKNYVNLVDAVCGMDDPLDSEQPRRKAKQKAKGETSDERKRKALAKQGISQGKLVVKNPGLFINFGERATNRGGTKQKRKSERKVDSKFK